MTDLRALVIGHDHIGDPGYVGRVLEAAGWSLHPFTVVPEHRFHAPDVEVGFPDPTGWDLVLTLGAPWPRSAITTWVPREVELLARAHEEGTPILGICAGAQFLAEALGGGHEAMQSDRIGWHAVRPGAEDIPAGPWFQWHSDRIATPPGAEVIADSPDGPEVFRVGTSTGVQFHPEMSAALLERWLEATPLPAERATPLRHDAARYESGALTRAEQLLQALNLV
jgi:GMP synthase-like glutamine amidotransferase